MQFLLEWRGNINSNLTLHPACDEDEDSDGDNEADSDVPPNVTWRPSDIPHQTIQKSTQKSLKSLTRGPHELTASDDNLGKRTHLKISIFIKRKLCLLVWKGWKKNSLAIMILMILWRNVLNCCSTPQRTISLMGDVQQADAIKAEINEIEG